MDSNFAIKSEDLETKYKKLQNVLKNTNLIYSIKKEKSTDSIYPKKLITESNHEQAIQFLKKIKPYSKIETQAHDLRENVRLTSPSKHYYEMLMKSKQDEKYLRKTSNHHSMFEYEFSIFKLNLRFLANQLNE